MLNKSFTEIGMRMTVDSKLPRVGYQIKMQRILNWFFISLLFVVMESSALYFAITRYNFSIKSADKIDLVLAIFLFLYTLFIFISYYYDLTPLGQRFK